MIQHNDKELIDIFQNMDGYCRDFLDIASQYGSISVLL
jgi:hypothetical protein